MKKTLVTINKEIATKKNTTHGGLVRICEKYSDARFIDGDGTNYDFKNNKVITMKFKEGKFYDEKLETPNADIWIFYSDGYNTDTQKLGYQKPTDYHEFLMSFLEKQVLLGNVGEIINSPDAERKTLKKYFEELDPLKFSVIPTYTFNNLEELYQKFKDKGILISKPDWGGAMKGVSLLKDEKDLKSFREEDLSNWVFQDYCPGIEKRMWIAGGNFVEGRFIQDRNTPWENFEKNSLVGYYNSASIKENRYECVSLEEFEKNLRAVEKIVKKTGLVIGSVDFLGNKINELNGSGTGYTSSDRENTIKIDARQHLFDYIQALLIK